MLDYIKALFRRPDLYSIVKEELYQAERELHVAQNNLESHLAMRDLQEKRVFRLSQKISSMKTTTTLPTINLP